MSGAPNDGDRVLAAPSPNVVLSALNVNKSYGTTQALRDVSLEVHAGEVHFLLGENGAGKSTLVKIITGLEAQDSGALLINRRIMERPSVAAARASGVGVVYQHPVVFPDLTVIENIYAGRQPRRGAWPIVDFALMRASVRSLFDRMDVRIDPDARMAALSIGERQLVEIAKALSEEIKILILDEPTAALPDKEVGSLFAIVRRLAKSGVAILFISHRLDEVFDIGDRVTVFRDGRKVATECVADVSKDGLIEMMVGRKVGGAVRQQSSNGAVLLETRRWGRRGVFADMSFSLRRGEILAFAGLVGSGGSDVARSLFAVEESDEGELFIDGEIVKPRSPHQMMARGVAFVPGDRQNEGLIPDWTVARNITLPVLGRLSAWASFPRQRSEEEVARGFVTKLRVRPNESSARARSLSGGNQQKVLLSKWLAASPKILILEDPTAGIDIGAKVEVHRLIENLASEGMALIVVSSDLAELIAIAHRILVFGEGRIVREFDASVATREAVMRAAMDVGFASRASSDWGLSFVRGATT
jgi:rhamnose transport system ATP-binding protein